ncbi:MAG: arginase family protein [Bacteroidota bacterium]
MNKVAVIGAPSSVGARHAGQEHAPELFRRQGPIENLRNTGLDVLDKGVLPMVSYQPDIDHPQRQNLALVSAVARQVSDRIYNTVQANVNLLVLGGDCTITLGVLAGMSRHFPNIGLNYFDGDVDLNTPADTPSGVFDGMVMAHIIGEGAVELTHISPRHPLMPQEKIILFGYNSNAGCIDTAEIERLEQY